MYKLMIAEDEEPIRRGLVYTIVSYRITCNNGNQRPLINP